MMPAVRRYGHCYHLVHVGPNEASTLLLALPGLRFPAKKMRLTYMSLDNVKVIDYIIHNRRA